MYGQSEDILLEWKRLDQVKPPIFKGSLKDWQKLNTIARRSYWQAFMKKSLNDRNQFLSSFNKKGDYWDFNFEPFVFKKGKSTRSQEQKRLKEQLMLKKRQEEQSKAQSFSPSAASMVAKPEQKTERPLRMVNKPDVPIKEERPLVLVETDMKAPQMPQEQAPIMPLPSQTVPQEEIVDFDVLKEQIAIQEYAKKSKVPYIIGGAIVGLIMLKTFK